MTRTLLMILCVLGLLLAGSAWGATKVVRSWTWNNHTYTRVQFDDGSTVDIKGATGEKSVEALSKADVWKTATEAVKTAELAVQAALAHVYLDEASVEQIKAEVAKRKLTAKDLGLEVAK